MDERSSTDDASASRVSLVDSRRLMFEKIVTSKQASRPDLATDEGAARINRRNGRQPRSFCADKVNSFRDQLGSSSCTDEPAKSFVTEVAPFISRHSCDVAGDQPVNDDGRVVVTSPVAASSLPPLPSGENTVIAVSASENNSSSDENDSQVPTNQCHPSVDTLPSSKNNPPTLAILCQLSGDTNHPPNSSKRTSYHRAVLNGAKLRVAKTVSPPVTVNETSPTVDPLRNGGDVNDPPLDRSPPESKGASDQRLTAEIAISSTPTVTHSSVKDLSVALNDRLRSSSSSSPNTCEPVMVTSGGNVADEPSPSVADVVATSAVDFVFTNVADIVDTGAANVVATSSADTVIIHAAEPSVTCVSDVAAADVANVAATAAANVVVTGAHNVVTTTTTVTTTVINPTVSATVSLASVTAASIDYPEDLNPFDDDDDENDVSGDALEVSRGNISGEHNSTNPFGSDSEDEHADESKITSASTNPFWSGSEEEDSEENLSPRKPVPLPRTVKKPVASSSPLPSPRPRPRVTTGCSSSEISPATSCHKLSGDSADLAFHRSSTSINNFTMRKKKPAPPPPPLQANSNHVDVMDTESVLVDSPSSLTNAVLVERANESSLLPPLSTNSVVPIVPPRAWRRSIKNQERKVDNVISSVGKQLSEAKPEDCHDIFGQNLASKLRNLPNGQRIYLEKIINSAVFEAELGNLSRHCYLQIPNRQGL